jgi:hypothetical protein
MKFIFFSILILAGFSIGLVSCSSGDYSATPGNNTSTPNPIYQPPASNNKFTASIDGTAYKAGTSGYFDTTISGLQLFQIYGYGSSDTGHLQIVQLEIDAYNGPGTYTLNGNPLYAQITYTPTDIQSFQSADSGAIVITDTSNNVITGTFHFVTSSGINVTNGVFTKLPKL